MTSNMYNNFAVFIDTKKERERVRVHGYIKGIYECIYLNFFLNKYVKTATINSEADL